MPNTSPGRFSPCGLSLRAKAFLLVGLSLLALTALGFAIVSTLLSGSLGHLQTELVTAPGGAPVPSMVSSTAADLRNMLAGSAAVFFGVLVAFSFLVIEFLFVRKITRMDKELRTSAEAATRLSDSLDRRHGESENQEALILSVLDSASEGIMAFRSLRNEKGAISDFVMVLANKSAGAMMNRESKDMLGKCLLGLFPGNLSEGLFDRYVRVVETKIGEQLEAFDGHEDVRSWFHISVEPWSDGFVVTLEEIGQRKRVEQELKASVEELERFNRAMIGRENRVLEMKAEVNLVRSRMGLPPEYKTDSLSDEP